MILCPEELEGLKPSAQHYKTETTETNGTQVSKLSQIMVRTRYEAKTYISESSVGFIIDLH